MKKANMKSFWNAVIQEVYDTPDHGSAKEIVINHINGSDIDYGMKTKMLRDVNRTTNLIQLQAYVTNSLLKFQGLGVR